MNDKPTSSDKLTASDKLTRRWHEYEDNPAQDFGAYLEWCINVVGGNSRN